jgi:hypothetical protein
MTVSRIREMLRMLAADERITLKEVNALLEVAHDENQVTAGEIFFLEAALQAHEGQFTKDAYQALKKFLDGRNSK